MAYLEIKQGDHHQTLPVPDGRCVIGKDRGKSQIHLDDPAVSRQHAEIVPLNGGFLLRDLGSSNHTYVNDRQIGEVLLQDQDTILIRPFILVFHGREAGPGTAERPAGHPEREPDAVFEFKRRIHREFIKRMDLKKMDVDQIGQEELRRRVKALLGDLLVEFKEQLAAGADVGRVEKELADDILGLGPLEDMIHDDSISEIMVNNKDQVYIEKEGRLFLTDQRFYDDAQVLQVIDRIISETGKSINESNPIVDTRLVSDGSRVNAIIPPLAVKGPCLTIRKFSKKMLGPEVLVAYGSIEARMVAFLKLCVTQRKNIIVSGGTGSGKTTLLNILSSFIPAHERIVTVEDAAELQLQQEHLITLEARPANLEGKGAVSIRDLVRNCLRMRPDRIIVGECRGAEALDMLQAMNTGHDGSLTTIHANSPRDALTRLETMVLMTGLDLPMKAIRNQVEAAIDIIIQQSRFADGSRKVTHITEITGMENDVITTQDIFLYEQKGFDADGKVAGAFKPTTVVPSFYDQLKERGIATDYSLFKEP